jgi:hypothetical protein
LRRTGENARRSNRTVMLSLLVMIWPEVSKEAALGGVGVA